MVDCCGEMHEWETELHGEPDFRGEWWVSEKLPPFSYCPWCGEPLPAREEDLPDHPPPSEPYFPDSKEIQEAWGKQLAKHLFEKSRR